MAAARGAGTAGTAGKRNTVQRGPVGHGRQGPSADSVTPSAGLPVRPPPMRRLRRDGWLDLFPVSHGSAPARCLASGILKPGRDDMGLPHGRHAATTWVYIEHRFVRLVSPPVPASAAAYLERLPLHGRSAAEMDCVRAAPGALPDRAVQDGRCRPAGRDRCCRTPAAPPGPGSSSRRRRFPMPAQPCKDAELPLSSALVTASASLCGRGGRTCLPRGLARHLRFLLEVGGENLGRRLGGDIAQVFVDSVGHSLVRPAGRCRRTPWLR
ncbi:hypothetical protein QFZ75_000254 [Streptomyces sp. V3I8]|nr:hypothetical protein [Streptomyces sp. V3I8]